MKLAIKLTLAIMLGLCVVLAANAFLRVRREVALFERFAAREDRLLGRALGAAVEAVFRTDGEQRARDLVRDANEHETKLTIDWLGNDLVGRKLGAQQAATLAANGTYGRVATVDGEQRRYTYVAVGPVGARIGALELSEPLLEERQYIDKTIRDTMLHAGVMVAVCGGLALLLGLTLVGRPTRALVAKAQRVGLGHFDEPLVLRQRDELGELAAEMNRMCDRLVEANDRVAQATAARLEALEQLRHADRLMTVGKLASGIAHELGTPLNVVSGRARMITSGEAQGEEAVDCARIVVEASERMTRIIRQLLDFARQRGPQKARHDLLEVSTRTLALVQTLADKRKVELRVRGESAIAAIDLGQIQQALTNLVVNGIQAMLEPGTVEVEVKAVEATPPEGSGRRAAPHVCIRVIDAGSGIDAESLPHIFEPFFTTKGVGEGTGLGLSVAYGIVREHGGWIDVQSKPGHGTTFSMFLPRGEAS